jgi:two-component system chemotaxis sensor kinase CheA
MNLEQALQTFIEESRELLSAMEDALLVLEGNPGDTDAIAAVFRAMHTIKGSAGLFGLDHIVSFTHVAESVMDRVRDGKLVVDEPLAALLLACGDHIGDLVDRLAAGQVEPDADLRASDEILLNHLRTHLGAAAPAKPAGVPLEREAPVRREGGGLVASDAWHISVRFGQDLFRNGFDPLSFVRYLGTLGRLVHVETLTDTMPEARDMDPESCYLGFEIRLLSTADKSAIEGAFDFVRDDCSLSILPPHSHIREYLRLIEALPEDNARLGEILVACGALTARELEEALLHQGLETVALAAGQPAAPPLGEILVERKMMQPEVVGAALEKQQHVHDAKAREARIIRVDAAKLDHLINLVGELVIAGAGANLLAGRSGDGALQEATALISRFVEDIRDGALRLRMVQIGETFSRYNRVVRDVGKELGKDIELTITGAETELDKSVVEKIGDPLMHLVRNAMDHGLEQPEVRIAAGKPARGALRLNAYHDSGSIVIEVSDDGGGLNRDRILHKAMERGLVSPNQKLSEQEIHMLIFAPGFSTAEQVSNLSGRGVGMDVVRRNIEALRGTVELDSEPGRGTTVRIRLPLTLAIIDGFLVGVAGASYVIPLDQVLECVELSEADRQAAHLRSYVDLRGEVLPFIRLRDYFEHEGAWPKRENIVVVKHAGQKAGIVVDELQGEFQTVIKPLGRMFAHLRGIGGSTILGSGEVALILDVPSLLQRAASNEFPSAAAPSAAAPSRAALPA